MFESLTIPSIAPCPLGSLLEELDDASAKNLRIALDLPRSELSHNKIALNIRAEANRPISAETVAAHRNKACRCSKS